MAIDRKNWLFVGNDEGARRAAALYSLVVACKLNKVNPFAYLRDVLNERTGNPGRDPAELTPMAWKAEHAAKDAAANPSAPRSASANA